MNAPLYKFGAFGDEVSLIVAFVIGIGFGFFLERAGFGSARKLAAQFYFTDMSVLKVMFTAIVTAMVGLYVLSRIGFVDLSLVYLTPTYLVPQIIGGLLLGIGFVIGGYCPGTSCVSAATGKVDGMVYLTGIFAGLIGFAEMYPRIEKWVHTTAMGKITLAQLTGIPYGVLVLAVIVMALGAFAAAEWGEAKANRRPVAGWLLGTVGWNSVRVLAAVLLVLGAGAAIAGSPYRGNRVTVDTKEIARIVETENDHVTAAELAGWITQGRSDYELIDLRSEREFAEYHIPGAKNIPITALDADTAPRNEKIVLYSEGGIHSAQAWFLLKAQGYPSVYFLKGGLDEWKEAVLGQKPVTQVSAAPAQTPAAVTAVVPAPPKLEAPSTPPATEAPKKKKKEGC